MTLKQAVNNLRQEYFELKAPMHKELRHLEATVRAYLKELEYSLEKHERIDVESRVKDCESAIDSLRRKQPGRDFEDGKQYTLNQLKDLVGLRILTFPTSVMKSVNVILSDTFKDWSTDHDMHGGMQIYKYYNEIGDLKIPCEIQIVSMLTGKFWDVEHAALYKPNPAYKGAIEGSFTMDRLYKDVMNKLAEFEKAFEETLQGN